ncbi:unnamed protein product [Cochlearia groenlandica]
MSRYWLVVMILLVNIRHLYFSSLVLLMDHSLSMMRRFFLSWLAIRNVFMVDPSSFGHLLDQPAVINDKNKEVEDLNVSIAENGGASAKDHRADEGG